MRRLYLLLLLPLVLLSGCSFQSPDSGVGALTPVLQGRVRGGQLPVSGAIIQLYAVGTTGDGSTAAPLLSPAAATDANGNFNINGDYICPSSSTLVYIVATGGNPGLGSGASNPNISLMAVLGECGSLSATTFITINELTTVAAINALAAFTSSLSAIGSSSSDSANLAAAFALAADYVNVTTGSSPGASVPTGTAAPQSELDTLANILAVCVNSAGGTAGDSSTCGNLFLLTAPSGSRAPTDTLTAALDLALNPTLSTTALFNLAGSNPPFQPSLTSAPLNFGVGLTVTAGLSPSAPAIPFPGTPIGTPSAVQTVTLTNTSASPISIPSISIGGLDAGDFSQTNNCPSSLAANAVCSVQVTFTPGGLEIRDAVLSIANSSANSTLLVPLEGTEIGEASPQILSLSPASIAAGSTGATVTITGTGFIQASEVYLYGAYAQATTFGSAQSLSFTLGSQYLSGAGMIPVAVRNSGVFSNTVDISVANPAPVLSSISPSAVEAGAPNFELTLSGSGFNTGSTVSIGGTAYPITLNSATQMIVTVSSTQLAAAGSLALTVTNPTPGGGTSAAQQLQVLAGDTRVRTLNVATNDIASDPVRTLVYASVSSSSSTDANSVVAIDPLQGVVVTSQPMASQPERMAISSDGSYLYVVQQSGQITRLLLPSLTQDISWTPSYAPDDIEVAPGAPHTIAVTGGAYIGESVTIYDDGVARPTSAAGSYAVADYSTVAWGANTSVLYGTQGASSGGPEFIFAVNSGGISLSSKIPSVFCSYLSHLYFDQTSGWLYDNCGDVVNPANGAMQGAFNIQNTISYEQQYNPFVIDTAGGKAFFLNQEYFSGSGSGSGIDIQSFDVSHFTFLGAVNPAGLSGSRIVRWGASGLAVGGGSEIFLIDGPFVSSAGVSSSVGAYTSTSSSLISIAPQTVPAGSGATNVVLTGTNFTQAATVTWNGQTLPVTWQSSTQLTATIPASMLSQAVTAPVAVSNGPGTETSNGIPLAVLPDLGPNTQMTAVAVAGQDLTWDPTRSLLYVAATDGDAEIGNSIVAVDPSLAAVQNVVYAGSQPASLGISSDGQYLYAGFEGAQMVEQFSLSNFSPSQTIPVNGASANESYPLDVKVAPGEPQTIAVSMGNHTYSPQFGGGLAILDNGTPRPSTTLPYGVPDRLAWGSNASTLISSGGGTYIFAVGSSGVTASVSGDSAAPTYGYGRPHYDPIGGLVYIDGGGIVNPVTGASAGVLTSSGLVVPDGTLGRVFVLREAGNPTTYAIDIFNLAKQTLIKTITLPGITGYPTQFVRWGPQGLAFLTDNSSSPGDGMLYILQGSDISGLTAPPAGAISLSPPSAIAGMSAGATITVNGSSFLQSSMALVNGTPHATTYISSTQLSFQLSATDQAFATYLAVEAVTSGVTSPATSFEVANPVPGLSSLAPGKTMISTTPAVTISGSGFQPTSTVIFNGSVVASTYVSPTQLTITTPSENTAGEYSVVVSSPGPGGGSSAAFNFEVDNPMPAISNLSPVLIAAGSAGQTAFVLGSGFVPATVIQVNGMPRTVTYYSSTEVSTVLTSADLASAGTLSLTAVNPGPGGGTSGAASITVSNSLPGPITLNPAIAIAGIATPTTVTINGSNLVPATVAEVNGSMRSSTYISSTQISFQLTVADQANATNLVIAVVNPSPGGGSAAVILPVAAATTTPVITSISPSQIVVGSTATTLEILGTGFSTYCSTQWNGSPLTGSGGNSSYLFSQVPANLLITTGTATVTVSCPTATPPLSNSETLSIVSPSAPTLTSISPAFGPINTAFTATLGGTNFTNNSVVAVNGVQVPTTFAGSTQLTAQVPANLVPPGNDAFTVSTPAPGGGTSSGLLYTAYVPIANNSMVYNAASGLFYLSVPSSAGAPYGNSVVSLDPVTGNLGTPIYVGSEPDQMAISSDGTTLWVGLDGASAVREVNLTTQAAGIQFPLPTASGVGSNVNLTASAFAVLPGQDNSIVVAAGNTGTYAGVLGIYDSGVLRGSLINTYPNQIFALQADPTNSEFYAATGSTYYAYAYGSSGLTLKAETGEGLMAQSDQDVLSLASGLVYTDFGNAYNAQTGALAGSFSSGENGSNPTAVDSNLGLAFVLDSTQQYLQLPNQIQIFNLSSYAQQGGPIPVNVATMNSIQPISPISRLERWGADGLAFRNGVSVYALRSNLVQNLSSVLADLSVTLSASGANLTGTQTTYTAAVTNNGPATATEVSLTGSVPATGVLISATSPAGACFGTTVLACDLGQLANGATATVTLTVNQVTPGTATLSVQTSESQADPNLMNNSAFTTATITGTSYGAMPVANSVMPSTVPSGSSDTPITITGSAFATGSTVLFDGAALSTTVTSSTQLNATVPAASLAALGWHQIAVSNPSPGGGTSAPLALTVYTVLAAGANHIAYEPFSQTIYATLGSAMPQGNSVQAITPATATSATPVFVGSEPSTMAVSDAGQVMYVLATGSGQIIQYKILTQQPGLSFTVAPTFGDTTQPQIAVQTGGENTIAFVQDESPFIQIIDFNPATQTAAARPVSGGSISEVNPIFLSASDLLVEGYESALQNWLVSPSGVALGSSAPLALPTPFKVYNGTAYSASGAVASVAGSSPALLGTFTLNTYGMELPAYTVDPALGFAYFVANSTTANGYTATGPTGVVAFSTNTYAPSGFVPLNIATFDGSAASTGVDLIRWGQDGLAALTSAGNIYLLRGPAVLPALLQNNTPPMLTATSPSVLTHGSGNTVVSVSGSNFLPGVAVAWNGAYRTTTFVSPIQVNVDIPASDLTQPATTSITAVNPGSAASAAVTLPIN